MTVTAVVWLTIGIVTAIILLALIVGLFRELKRVAASVIKLNNEVQPLITEIQRDAERAQQRTLDLERKQRALAEDWAESRRRSRR